MMTPPQRLRLVGLLQKNISIQNISVKPIIVEILCSGHPFSVKTRRIKVEARNFMVVPIEFRPTIEGEHKETLIVKGASELVRLDLVGLAK